MPPGLLIGWKWKSSWLCYLLYTCCCWADHNRDFLLLPSLNGKIISVSVMFSGFQLSNSSQRKPPSWDGGCCCELRDQVMMVRLWSGAGAVTWSLASSLSHGASRQHWPVISPIIAQDVQIDKHLKPVKRKKDFRCQLLSLVSGLFYNA